MNQHGMLHKGTLSKQKIIASWFAKGESTWEWGWARKGQSGKGEYM